MPLLCWFPAHCCARSGLLCFSLQYVTACVFVSDVAVQSLLSADDAQRKTIAGIASCAHSMSVGVCAGVCILWNVHTQTN